jgi:TolB protein
MMVVSMSEGGYFHLFAFHPENLPLTRLTFGEWDDIQPALSPDGSKIAFASHQGGQWDIYLLDLTSGETIQLTDDPAYDGAPTWASDSNWLAFEKYAGGNLDIFIQPADGTTDALPITFNPAADYEPSWNPNGSQIAFTSTRSGGKDIWVADINRLGESDFIENFTFNTTLDQYRPSWSPQGELLAWVAPFEGYESIYIADFETGAISARYLGNGNQVAWDPTGQYILASICTPDQTFLASYHHETNTYSLPPFTLDGHLNGISWSVDQFPHTMPDNLDVIAAATPGALWETGVTPDPGTIYGRQRVLPLADVKAPEPSLSALAIKPFYALRDRIVSETGWDVLSDLENAYIPLTLHLPPGRSLDWLYTGRAFALHPALLEMGWMKVVREDFGDRTYWRIFIKTRYQDGSQGKPMTQVPWNFNARFTGSTTAYEEGGAPENAIPAGYWIDFTALAIEYGWERQPALLNWRSYYQGARFNVFAITSGLDWEEAMLQIYPPETFFPQPTPYP